MPTAEGRIHSVETFGSLDGPGIRYIVFFQGCPLRCLYCHNVDTLDPKGGMLKTSDEIVADILRYKSFISTGGVTLSGGEPLFQPEFEKEFLVKCHENGIHTAIDSSGGIPLQKCKEALDEADLILLDIKALPDDLCTRIIGQSSKNSIDILNYREKTGKSVWIRHVIVPGLTLDYGLLTSLADFLKNYKCIERIELLPFHKMGEYKWKELNKAYTLTDTPEPTYTEIENAKRIFSERGFNIK